MAVRKLGGFNFLSVAQRAALPCDERARLVRRGLVQFPFDGREVPVRPTLLWIRELARMVDVEPDGRERGRRR